MPTIDLEAAKYTHEWLSASDLLELSTDLPPESWWRIKVGGAISNDIIKIAFADNGSDLILLFWNAGKMAGQYLKDLVDKDAHFCYFAEVIK